jgi:hypothetical protein
MKIRNPVLAVLLVAAASGATVAASAPPPHASARDAVEAFYRFHLTQAVPFTPASVDAHAGFLTPELAALCRAYFTRPPGPDSELMVESDPFTDAEDMPTQFHVESAREDGDRAAVVVSFDIPRRHSARVAVTLLARQGAWKIDDVRYGREDPSLRNLLVGHR